MAQSVSLSTHMLPIYLSVFKFLAFCFQRFFCLILSYFNAS
uniref:Uncharacterized protein n=1 Tax=Anguilla anguilla TaxID=7936 RepID=A0A0E9U9I4_ANGAN